MARTWTVNYGFHHNTNGLQTVVCTSREAYEAFLLRTLERIPRLVSNGLYRPFVDRIKLHLAMSEWDEAVVAMQELAKDITTRTRSSFPEQWVFEVTETESNE